MALSAETFHHALCLCPTQQKKIINYNAGSAHGVKKRLQEHNNRKVPATRDRIPLEVIHYEAFASKYDAFLREKWLKTGWGRKYLQKSLHNKMKSLGG